MKNRQKFTVTEKSLFNKIERFDREVDKKFLELRAKKTISNNPLIQKNIRFLQSYNNLFKGPYQHSGDADSFFRKSLRSYSGSLDILRDLHLENSPLLQKPKRPKSTFTKHHHCEDHQPLFGKHQNFTTASCTEFNTVKGKSSVRELFSKGIPEQDFESSTESEDRDYFSPLGEVQSDFYPKKTYPSLEDHTEEPQPEEYVEASEVLENKEEEKEENLSANENTVEGKPSVINYRFSLEQHLISEEEEENTNRFTMAEDLAGEDMDEEFQPDTENEGEEDDELKDVEQMIQQASEELEKVAAENQQMMETLDEGEEDEALLQVTEAKDDQLKEGEAAGDGSYFKFDPAIDTAVLKELEEAEKQAKATAKVITELKDRVGELLRKEKMTEAEAKELEEKNKTLKAQMMLFEEKTKRIQFLLGQANLFDKMIPVQPPLQTKHAEDILPKMLVCGVADDFMPKIVLCQNHGKSRRCTTPCVPEGKQTSALDPIARKLDDSYNMQARLVSETADLEGNRYKLQSDIIHKDQTVECLQRQLCTIQNEMRMVYQENVMLNEQIQGCPNPSCPKNSRPNSPTRDGKMSCGPGRGLCPAEMENRLQEYSNTTSQLERQLMDVESEVRSIHQELVEVQKEREHLEHHRKMLALQPSPCPGLSFPCMPPPCGHPPCPPSPCSRPPPPCCPPEASGEDQQYKELKEKYKRLQEDFKAKLTEVAGLRADNEKLKEVAEKAEENRVKLEQKVKELEKKLKELRGDDKGGTSREQLIDLQQQLKVHKELYRGAQDELEELRSLVEDIQGQLNDYRNKYLEAIQTVEEQRRQIEVMRMENNRISEQVILEILRVKNQFQEKLQELAPLPDILKATQLKLQEAQQMHLLAERNNEAIARELQMYKDKLRAIEEEMAFAADSNASGLGEKEALVEQVRELEAAVQEVRNENDDMQMEMDRLREVADDNEKLANEKLHEITQLESQLESVREDSARQISRIKDRCEIVRKSMQNQINDMERQLAQTKAGAKAAEKERDDIRQKMQAQIRNLNENFEDAQMRIRNLQGHVNFLKSAGPMDMGPENRSAGPERPQPKADPCCCAVEY